MSYRLILRLKLSNRKARVTYQKCTNIWIFDFDPLRFEFRPDGYFLDETHTKEQLSCAQWIGL